MCTITATEFKKHFGKYSALARQEEIIVTNFGRVIYKTVPAKAEKVSLAKSLIGILPKDATIRVDPDKEKVLFDVLTQRRTRQIPSTAF